MATNQATVTDLSQRMLRPLTDVETTWADTALDDAFRHIITVLPDVQAALDDTTLAVDAPYRKVVVQVQCAMLVRILQNPDGVLEETTDDYTRRLDAVVSTGQLQLTDPEKALLRAGTDQPEGAFSVRAMPRSSYGMPRDWFPTTSTDTW